MVAARKPAAKSRPRKTTTGERNKGGRPRIPFDGSDKDKVRLLARAGTRHDIIAGIMGCSVDTLTRRFADELSDGLEHANALVGATLFANAMGGDLTAIIWWEKTRAGMRDIARHEHTGADGRPIELKDLSGLTDDQLELLERAAVLLAGSSVAGAGDQPEVNPL